MYNKPDSQYTKLVIAARKGKTETLGGGVLKARAKSAVVELEPQAKVASSDQSYEAITQQIAYLMSAITNQNANNNGQMVQDVILGVENLLILEPKCQKRIGRT